MLDGLNTDEDGAEAEGFVGFIASKKWTKKQRIFEDKAVEFLEDDDSIDLSNQYAVLQISLSDDDNDDEDFFCDN